MITYKNNTGDSKEFKIFEYLEKENHYLNFVLYTEITKQQFYNKQYFIKDKWCLWQIFIRFRASE